LVNIEAAHALVDLFDLRMSLDLRIFFSLCSPFLADLSVAASDARLDLPALSPDLAPLAADLFYLASFSFFALLVFAFDFA